METKVSTVTMGYDAVRVRVKIISIVFILLGSLSVPILGQSEDVEAAPNPIPIVSLSLFPTQQEAKVDHGQGDTVQFGGNCTVEQMQFVTSTVTLTATVNEGWAVTLSPQTLVFPNPGTLKFTVLVTVPAGVPDDTTANVIVTASCKVPLLAPVKSAASAVITVDNTSPDPEWAVNILDPREGELYTTNDITISGTASYNLGDITSVEVKVCTGPWTVATGTTEWTIDYDCSFLNDGEHAIYVRARSGEEEVSPIVESMAVQDRSQVIDDPIGGNVAPGDTEDPRSASNTYLIIGAFVITAVIVGYWMYSRRQRDTREYLAQHY